MRFLLDTHVFLWWLNDGPDLGRVARSKIADPASTIFVSAASLWEISIKADLGRLEAPLGRLRDEIEANDFIELPIEGHHAIAAGGLPKLHGDPFDRMLIAQAQLEGCSLVTRDRALEAYSVALVSADR